MTGPRECSSYETNLSAKQYTQETDARLSRPHGDARRAQRDQAAPCQGAKKIDGKRATETGAHLVRGDVAEGQRNFSEIGPPEKTTGILKAFTYRTETSLGKFRRYQPAERTSRNPIRDHGERQGRQLSRSQPDQAASSRIFSSSPKRIAACLRYPHHRADQRRRAFREKGYG